MAALGAKSAASDCILLFFCSELGLKRFTVLDNRPTLVDMVTKFRRTKLIACVGSTVLTLAMNTVMSSLWP